jgi:hypothetical protein
MLSNYVVAQGKRKKLLAFLRIKNSKKKKLNKRNQAPLCQALVFLQVIIVQVLFE